jgi:IPT/TIG domain
MGARVTRMRLRRSNQATPARTRHAAPHLRPRVVFAAIAMVGAQLSVVAQVATAQALPPVTGLSLSLSTYAAAATQVSYNVEFTPSGGGSLAAGSGVITISAPEGTFPTSPSSCMYDFARFTNLETQASAGVDLCGDVSAAGHQLHLTPPIAIVAGQKVEVSINGLGNPARPGAESLTLQTSSQSAGSVSYTIVPSSSIGALSVALSSSAAGATRVTYTVEFTTSATGALAEGSGLIELGAPVGSFHHTAACGVASATITDLATHASAGVDMCSAPVSEGGAQLQLVSGIAIAAGQRVSVAITGIDNPLVPGPKILSLHTSSDSPGSATYSVTGHAVPVVALELALSTPAALASGVTYTLSFRTSTHGGLSAGSGAILLSAPTGTFPSNVRCNQAVATVTNLATHASGSEDLCTAEVSTGGAELQVLTPVDIAGGQQAELAITGLYNPATPGLDSVALSTSSNGARSVGYRVVQASPLAAVSVDLSDNAAGAAPVTYAVGISTPPTGALVASSGTITLHAAAGTFPSTTNCGHALVTVTNQASGDSQTEDLCSAEVSKGGGQLQLTTPVAVAAGQRAVVAVSGLDNPDAAGPALLSVWTSSNGVRVKVPFVIAPGAPISGQVGDTSANAVPGAEVEACPSAGGQCYDTLSLQAGSFKETVPYGRYRLTAFPPEGASLGQSTNPTLVAVTSQPGASGANITMPVLQPLPAGVSVAGQDGGVPTFYSGSPVPMTVRGCRHGTGAVVVRGTSTATGASATFLVPLLESAPGSGRYSASLPPLWPVHGDVTIGYHIYCPEAIAPTAGLAAGDSVVNIHGTGFTGATAVNFGTVPAKSFKVMSSSVIEAVAPPGSGTVMVTVTTPGGTTRGGPLSRYTYISLGSVAPSHGSASGATDVVIKGQNLGQVQTLWFGDRLATNLKVVSNNELEAVTPEGSGEEPISIGQIGIRLPGEPASSGPPPTLYFRFGAGPGQAQDPEDVQAALTTPARPLAVEDGVARRTAEVETSTQAPTLDAFPLNGGENQSSGAPNEASVTSWSLVGRTFTGIALISLVLLLDALAAPVVVPLTVATYIVALYASTLIAALSDPSGTVSDTNGGPVSGATAVLEQAPTPEGPFSPAVAANPGIVPHVNPQKTGANGEFHWDVVSDYYKVVASAPRCHAPGDLSQPSVSTPVLPVPPPRFGLDLVLQCSDEAPAARPTITSLSKDVVATTGGTQIEVVGTGFTPSATVRFGPSRSPLVDYVSPNLLDVTVPPGQGRVRVYVTTPGGATGANASDQLTYSTVPVVAGVTPSSGPAAGGTRVIIHGSGLMGADLVQVGSTIVTNFTVEAGGTIEAVIPSGPRGTVDIKVITPVGTSAPTLADRFTYVGPEPHVRAKPGARR